MSSYLNINNFNLHINIDLTTVRTIPIVHFDKRSTLIKIIENIKDAIAGEDIYSVTFIEEGKQVNFAKNAFICVDLFDLSLNDRRFLNAIILEITKKIQTDSDLQQEFTDVTSEMERYFEKICEIGPIALEHDEPNISSFIKSMNIRIPMESMSFNEKLFSYVDLVSKIISQPIIFFVNLPAFFSRTDMKKLYKDAAMKEVHLISLEIDYGETSSDENSVICNTSNDNYYSII